MVPSSRGLGRGPLKAATRVRIPLGSPMQASLFKRGFVVDPRDSNPRFVQLRLNFALRRCRLLAQ